MISAVEFREFGAECLEWAKTAQSDEERQLFLQMVAKLAVCRCEPRRTSDRTGGRRPSPPSSIPLAP
jgi:hypothetical protein